MLPSTVQRVPRHTADAVNERIRQQTEENVARCAQGGATAIEQRLAELDQEWDIERTLEANAATVTLLGTTLAMLHSRRWLLLPGLVGTFLLQHAVQGWCPPLALFRRLGFRTAAEIHQERYALKALRGDFSNVSSKRTDPANLRLAISAAGGRTAEHRERLESAAPSLHYSSETPTPSRLDPSAWPLAPER